MKQYKHNHFQETLQSPDELAAVRCCTVEEFASNTNFDSKCVSKIDGSNNPPGQGDSPLCFWAQDGYSASNSENYNYTKIANQLGISNFLWKMFWFY